MNPIRILIVDDHAILRSALKMLIANESDMIVVGEAASAESALIAVNDLRPDVITLDLSMPDKNGQWLLHQLSLQEFRSAAMVVTMNDDPEYVRSAIAAGAKGYVTKTATDTELITAIRAVHEGRMFVSVSTQLGESKQFHLDSIAAVTTQPDSLNDRERVVMLLYAQGFSNKEIASRLSLSVKTIETYRARVAANLGLHSRAEVLRYALDRGLIQQPLPKSLPDDPKTSDNPVRES